MKKKKSGLRWWMWLFLAFVALLVIGSLFPDVDDDTEKVSIADYPVFNEGDQVDLQGATFQVTNSEWVKDLPGSKKDRMPEECWLVVKVTAKNDEKVDQLLIDPIYLFDEDEKQYSKALASGTEMSMPVQPEQQVSADMIFDVPPDKKYSMRFTRAAHVDSGWVDKGALVTITPKGTPHIIPEWMKRDESSMAYIMMRDFVKDKLKSPATAKFPSLAWDNQVRAIRVSGQKYMIYGYVDAQNSFGALIRTKYTGVVEQTAKDKWVLQELAFSSD